MLKCSEVNKFVDQDLLNFDLKTFSVYNHPVNEKGLLSRKNFLANLSNASSTPTAFTSHMHLVTSNLSSSVDDSLNKREQQQIR